MITRTKIIFEDVHIIFAVYARPESFAYILTVPFAALRRMLCKERLRMNVRIGEYAAVSYEQGIDVPYFALHDTVKRASFAQRNRPLYPEASDAHIYYEYALQAPYKLVGVCRSGNQKRRIKLPRVPPEIGNRSARY